MILEMNFVGRLGERGELVWWTWDAMEGLLLIHLRDRDGGHER
jgi:hypothetical protein